MQTGSLLGKVGNPTEGRRQDECDLVGPLPIAVAPDGLIGDHLCCEVCHISQILLPHPGPVSCPVANNKDKFEK